MNPYNSKDALRAYYVRQLRASGYTGNAGGWVFSPTGLKRRQGWGEWIYLLAVSMRRLAGGLAQE